MVSKPLISRDPFFPQGSLNLLPYARTIFPLSAEHLFFYAYGRYALYQGLKSLGLFPGDRVLVPEYICNSVIAPFYALGIDVDLYPLNNKLEPDWGQITQLLSPLTKAFVLVNYFGFPNDHETTRKFCNEYDLTFIEDNAHGFLSYHENNPLGSFGDIAIFSFRKTIPVPNGSAMVVNRPSKVICDTEIRNSSLKLICSPRYLARQVVHKIANKFPQDHIKMSQNYVSFIEGAYDLNEEKKISNHSGNMAFLSKFILHRLDPEKIIDYRRKRYLEWKIFISACFSKDQAYALFPELPEGVCPYVFPVFARERDEFLKKMRRNGVEAFPWPFLPQASKENYFSKHIVCLPLSGVLTEYD